MDESDRNQSLMESTGLGLLPGIVLALFLVVLAMAGLLLEAWWVVFACVGVLVVVTLIIVGVVVAVMDESDTRRRRVPGLGSRKPRPL